MSKVKSALSRVRRINKYLYKLLILNELRHYYCRIRWAFLKKNLQTLDERSDSAPTAALNHNLSRFDYTHVFGIQGRMLPVLYPLSCLIKNKHKAKVLIVGPRTEDDIFLAKSLGLEDCIGLDLISYSSHVVLGDMHKMPFSDNQFDAVVFGWAIAYSLDPSNAAEEALRVLKPNGLIGIGWEWVLPEEKKNDFNQVNTATEHLDLFSTDKIVCYFDDYQDANATRANKSLILRVKISEEQNPILMN